MCGGDVLIVCHVEGKAVCSGRLRADVVLLKCNEFGCSTKAQDFMSTATEMKDPGDDVTTH